MPDLYGPDSPGKDFEMDCFTLDLDGVEMVTTSAGKSQGRRDVYYIRLYCITPDSARKTSSMPFFTLDPDRNEMTTASAKKPSEEENHVRVNQIQRPPISTKTLPDTPLPTRLNLQPPAEESLAHSKGQRRIQKWKSNDFDV